MTKAEMEQHWQQYAALIEHAARAEMQRLFWRVVEISADSWEHIDGMLRHLRHDDEGRAPTIEGFSFVLRYAPVLLDFERLDQLESFLKGKRRVAKAAPTDLFEDLADARLRMSRAHALWDRLEREGPCDSASLDHDFCTAHDDVSGTIAVWSASQLVRCNTVSGSLIVSLGPWADEAATVKCPYCATVATLAKSALFEDTKCCRCTRHTTFVYVADIQQRHG